MTIASAAVITCSDRVSAGEKEDLSGPAVRDYLVELGYECAEPVVVPDEIDQIIAAMESATRAGAQVIVTTGGTGVAARDVTPEATNEIASKQLPGFGELMRQRSLEKVATAALSRVQAAVTPKAIIINVPGSPSGAVENLEAVAHLIPHALELIRGKTDHVKDEES